MRIWLLCCVFLFGACADEGPQGDPPVSGAGRVVRIGGAAVSGATVEIEGKRATTGADGAFDLGLLEPGVRTAWVEADGLRQPVAARLVGDTPLELAIPEPRPSGTVDLFFAGDTVFGRRFEDLDADGIAGDGLIDPEDPAPGVEATLTWMRPYIARADLAVVNLETTVTDEGMIHPRKAYTLRSEPGVLAPLAESGVDVVTLGNNHVYDYLDEGVARMLDLVDEAGLARAGAGRDYDEAVEPLIIERNGIRIAIISATTIDGRSRTITTPDGVEVTPDQPPYYTAERTRNNNWVPKGGALFLNRENIDKALDKAAGDRADIEILVVHGGNEYDERASLVVQELSHYAIDAGVDLVIGHHPHVVQPVEVYNGVPILYSIGDFVFDSNFVETFPALAAEVRMSAAGVEDVVLRPLWLENYVPRAVVGPEPLRMLRRLAMLSGQLDTTLRVAPDGAYAVVELERGGGATTQVSVSSDALLPAPIEPARTGAWWVTAPPSGVEVGRDLLWSSAFDDSGAYDGATPVLGWDIVGSEKHVRGGELSIRRTNNSDTPSTARSTGRLPVSAGEKLTLTGRWRATDGSGSARALIAFYHDHELQTDPSATAAVTRTPALEWAPFQVTARVPTGAKYAQVELVHEVPTRGADGEVFFDDVALILWEPNGTPDATWIRGGNATITLSDRAPLGGGPRVGP